MNKCQILTARCHPPYTSWCHSYTFHTSARTCTRLRALECAPKWHVLENMMLKLVCKNAPHMRQPSPSPFPLSACSTPGCLTSASLFSIQLREMGHQQRSLSPPPASPRLTFTAASDSKHIWNKAHRAARFTLPFKWPPATCTPVTKWMNTSNFQNSRFCNLNLYCAELL